MTHVTKWSCLLFILLSQCQSNETSRYVFQKDLMYTVFDIVVFSKSPKGEVEKYVNNIWDILDSLEFELSPAEKGVLGRLNQEKIFFKQENPQIFMILSNFITRSKSISQQSQGAFDLTVYPLVRLWKFYQQDDSPILPAHKDILTTLKKVGMEYIYIDHEKIVLNNNVQLDLGAIAKGFAVDRAIQILQSNTNISSGFVNAGGNIRVFGTKPDGTPWRVGIRNPNSGKSTEIISLYDGDAIATSGDYEQYFEWEGKYYHHIFNPKTGYPVTHGLASVSVVLKGDAELTDILATTFLVLGKEKTLEFISSFDKNKDIALFFITRSNTNLLSSHNSLWEQRRKI